LAAITTMVYVVATSDKQIPVDSDGIEEAIIQVTYPEPNAIVTSPLTVTGKARGTWYFEANFPVRLLDGNGREIAVIPAQAQGEWMTTNFVPFNVILNFTNPTTTIGTLVLEKDNPSGLPEHADELRIPVRFNPSVAAQTRNIKLYFYNQNLDQDVNGNPTCSARGLVSVNRSISLTNTPIQDAVKELLKGPTTSERSQLPGTEFPLAGVTLTGANLVNGVLTLSFNDPQNKTTGGSCRITILKEQIEATALQFGGVSQVHYLPAEIFQP